MLYDEVVLVKEIHTNVDISIGSIKRMLYNNK